MILSRWLRRYCLPLLIVLSRYPWVKRLIVKIRNKQYEFDAIQINALINDAEKILCNYNNIPHVCIAIYNEGSIVDPVRDNTLRYRRFLENNKISYDIVDVSTSAWISGIEKYDIIVGLVSSKPSRLADARTKLFILEKYYKITCYPCFENTFIYEDKILQNWFFITHQIPTLQTFISNSRIESESFIKSCKYPLVSKIQTGSGSRGVDIIRNYKQARRFVNLVFSSGRNTYHTYLKQKDYVYFQSYIADSEYDLRVIVVGDKVFGYYRMKPEKDFRASGAGLVVKKALPEKAMRLAIECKEKMNTIMLAVDMIKSKDSEDFMIIEASIFFGVETAEQLHVDGKPGYYQYREGRFEFKEGKYWVQELALAEVINNWDKLKSQSH